MTGEQIELNIAKMDPDLRVQMTQGGVPNHCIAVLAEAGFTTSKMFRCFSPSLELLPTRATNMGIDPEKDLESMALVAKLQVVWATTTAYQVAKETDDAEKRVLGMTREMKPADYTVLRLQYEQLVKSKKKKQDLPGKTILENMNQELEDGEFRAPRLIEIPSQAEVE